MFTIMENRKRPRLELINTNNNNSNDNMQGVASTTTSMGTATLATIGGQSFILSNTGNSTLPANILLSICDDNSDESEEFIIDHSMLTQIKQEHLVATQTNNNQSHQQQPTLVTTVPQYRIVNQSAGKHLNSTPLNSPSMVNSTQVTTNSSLLSNSVHLPPGCEIYVIKEVIDSSKQVIAESCNTTSPKASLAANQQQQTTIKLEPMSPLPILRNNPQNLNANCSSSTITLNTPSTVTTSSITSTTAPDDTAAKRSLILEAYKKRDDKRRATHNEVERRRRDKINSWIFKLKEMLPSEVTPSNLSNSLINKDASTTTLQQNSSSTTRLLVHQQGTTGNTTTRTPPSDSKSQILIKACEYIKSMQEEIKSLRECLTENENLRLSNQRLQNEIHNLRSKQQEHQQKLHNNNNNNNIMLTTTNTTNNTNNNNHNTSDNSNDCELTLNSLNTTYTNVQLFAPSTNPNNNHHHLAGLVGLTTTNSNATTGTANAVNVTYAKRELIITDYVD